MVVTGRPLAVQALSKWRPKCLDKYAKAAGLYFSLLPKMGVCAYSSCIEALSIARSSMGSCCSPVRYAAEFDPGHLHRKTVGIP